jgi:LysM repeat protein
MEGKMKRTTTTSMILVLVALLLPVTTTAQEPVECETEYTVRVGDWLSKIADKYYGDMFTYPAIVAATNAQGDEAYADITNPDLIEPGWTLCIPGADDATTLMALSVGGSDTSGIHKEVDASTEVTPSADGILEMIELPDGTQCLHAGRGATLAFDGKRLNYTCGTDGEDEVGLIGDMGLDLDVLTVEKALYGRDDSGFVLKASERVVMTMVEIELPDGTQCLNAGHGATIALDGKRLNYTCGTEGEDEVGLIGDMQLDVDVPTVEKALYGRDGSGFVLKASEMTTARAVQGGEGP